jgi:hypothetical protein
MLVALPSPRPPSRRDRRSQAPGPVPRGSALNGASHRQHRPDRQQASPCSWAAVARPSAIRNGRNETFERATGFLTTTVCRGDRRNPWIDGNFYRAGPPRASRRGMVPPGCRVRPAASTKVIGEFIFAADSLGTSPMTAAGASDHAREDSGSGVGGGHVPSPCWFLLSRLRRRRRDGLRLERRGGRPRGGRQRLRPPPVVPVGE